MRHSVQQPDIPADMSRGTMRVAGAPAAVAPDRADTAFAAPRSKPEPGDPTVREAWAALRMIREAIEELGPVGVLLSAETMQREHGPMLLDEAAALVDGIRRMAQASKALEPQK